MIRERSPSILAAAPDEQSLKRFAELLNTEDYWGASLIEGKKKLGGDFRDIQKELRRLVEAWWRSGPNVNKLFNAESMLNHKAQEFRPHFIPTNSGIARLAYLTAAEYLPHVRPVETAIQLFLLFLLNPYNEKLGGPCKNCGRYYLKRSKRKKSVYCTEACGHRETARMANEKRRMREHSQRLDLVRRLSIEWAGKKTTATWKDWVARQPGITRNWVTRAERRGELSEPLKKS
jgi:hypothetical protein